MWGPCLPQSALGALLGCILWLTACDLCTEAAPQLLQSALLMHTKMLISHTSNIPILNSPLSQKSQNLVCVRMN